MPTDVATLQPNPFEAFGDAATRSSHPLLKFSKGDYVFGQNAEMVPIGTEVVAIMEEFMTGMIRWSNGTPTERLMGTVASRYIPPRRADLGDTDKSLWEVDDRGDPKDPWQLSNELPMVMRADIAKIFTFTTSSRGGLGALGELCKVYGRHMRTNPNDYPIVRLDVGSYMHPNKSYGRIKFPKFELIGWTDKGPYEAAVNGNAPVAGTDHELTEAIEHQKKERAARSARRAPALATAGDDDVPFD
jgi:hypothetical protein